MIYRKLSAGTYSAYCFRADGPWPEGMTRDPGEGSPYVLRTPTGDVEVQDLDMIVNGPNGTGECRAYSIVEFNNEFTVIPADEPRLAE